MNECLSRHDSFVIRSRTRRGSSAGFQPAVSPISNRQDSRHLGRERTRRNLASWKASDTAGWKPALLRLRFCRAAAVRLVLFIRYLDKAFLAQSLPQFLDMLGIARLHYT